MEIVTHAARARRATKTAFKKIKDFFFKTDARTILTLYFFFALIGGLLLLLPFATKKGVKIGFVDALYTAVSAMSTAGLYSISTGPATTFSVFGKIVIILLIQIGGMGIYLFIATFWIFLGKRINLAQRAMLASEQNLPTIKGVIRRMKQVFLTFIAIEGIAAIIFALYFYFVQPFGDISVGEAILEAVFLAVSLFMNAGLTIFAADQGFSTFLYNGHWSMVILSMLIIWIGGVGFVPMSEAIEWFKAKIKKQDFEFSYIAKILFKVHFWLFIVGGIAIFALEASHFQTMGELSMGQGLLGSFFTSASARSAGFGTFRGIMEARPGTRYLIALLMFIGASPNSAGGGVRTTTFILMVAGVVKFATNSNQAKLGKIAYKENTVQKAIIAFVTAVIFTVFAVFLISIADGHQFAVGEIFIEVISAFGTVGYTAGVSVGASVFSKLVLIVMMFIGRINVITFISVFHSDRRKKNYKISETELMVA